jgi:hypothetical protein
LYKEEQGESIATLIKNQQPKKRSIKNGNAFRMIATIYDKQSPGAIYDIFPINLIDEESKQKRKRNSQIQDMYDFELNTHSILKRELNENKNYLKNEFNQNHGSFSCSYSNYFKISPILYFIQISKVKLNKFMDNKLKGIQEASIKKIKYFNIHFKILKQIKLKIYFKIFFFK